MEPEEMLQKRIQVLDKKLRNYIFEIEGQRTECEHEHKTITDMDKYIQTQKEDIQAFLEILDDPKNMKAENQDRQEQTQEFQTNQ